MLAWIAYRIYRHDCFLNCDEDETEANAMTPGMYDDETTLSNSSGEVYDYGIVQEARIDSTIPSAYRLAKKQDGELVLQGAYIWSQGHNYGHEWRDIETVEHESS